MHQLDAALNKFLAEHGRGSIRLGQGASQDVSDEQRAELLDNLRGIARRNGVIIWLAVGVVVALTGASFAVAVAIGGPERMGYLAGIATALCLPIGLHLRGQWQQKVATEAFLAILPLLPKEQWLAAIERFYGRDTDDPGESKNLHPE